MLLANYASDSGSDDEAGPSSKVTTATAPIQAKAAAPAATKGKKRAGPIKITLDLPKTKSGNGGDGDDGEDNKRDAGSGLDEEEGRDVEKAKLVSGPQGGKGSSSLLRMLPAPKRKLPTAIPSGSSLGVNKSMAAKPKVPNSLGGKAVDEEDDEEAEAPSSSIMLPPSMARKAKKKEEPALDLFGLSATPTPAQASSSQTTLKPPQITSAPAVADFLPPPPTSDDPYPGYYQLPGGEWAAYEPEYYHSFFASSTAEAEEETDGGRIGKHWADFDQSAELQDVQASEGMSEARAAEARRQAAKPKRNVDEFEYKPIGQVKGLASERHQLSSLLNIAHTDRERLEDAIAANKKTARMAKTKYGF